MPGKKLDRKVPTLKDAASGLRKIQAGLDQVLSAAEDVLPSLGQELSQLMGRSLSVLAIEGREGLKKARKEVAVGADALETLLKDIDKLMAETAAPMKKAVKKELKRQKKARARAKKAAAPSLGDAMASVMNEAGKAMKAAELAIVLKGQGIKSEAKKFNRVIQSTLFSDKRFERDPKGGYRVK